MRIYFSGVGGVGIGPLLLIARDMGHEVLGSDAVSSRLTELIAAKGIPITTDQSGQQLRDEYSKAPLDWFIHTAALPPEHPELKAAQELGIKISKRDELLKQLIQDKGLKLIAVSGTHGKTTTTGMLVWLLEQLSIPVSYSIGTAISFGESGSYDPASEYFVYEADEYDRNFLQFSPYVSVIPAVDYDHPDTYPTAEDYINAFAEFIAGSHCTYLWSRDAEKIGNLPPGCVHTFGADTKLDDIRLAGEHNRKNAWLAVQVIHDLLPQTPLTKLYEHINNFPGTERRFEKLSDNLYTDYAHHPNEIRATIQLAKEVNKNVIVVYQPHQNTRQHSIQKDYKEAFNGVQRIYWLPTYQSREDISLAILTPGQLIKNLAEPSKAQPAELNEELKKAIDEHRAKGMLVLLMSAGDLDTWARQHWP